MNKVLKVQALDGGFLRVQMADGRTGDFDVNPYMASDFFAELKNDAYFKQVTLFFSGVAWPNGQDLGPDTISAHLLLTENLSH